MGGGQTLGDIINTATEVVLLAMPYGFALLYFLWSMYELVASTGDAEKMKQARTRLIWSIVIMFVIFSVGGIIAVLEGTLFGSSSVFGENSLTAPPPLFQ